MNEPHKAIDELSEGAQSVAKVLRYFFTALGVFMVLSVVFYCLSGFFIVETGENVIVMNFGKIVDTKKETGWYLTFPKPIATKFRRVITRPVTIDSNYFWYEEKPDRLGVKSTQTKVPDDPLRVGKDGYILTRDNNIAHIKWSVIYQIDDIEDFYTRYSRPEDALRLLLRSEVIKQAARLNIDTILSDREDQFRLAVRKALSAKVAGLQMGIRVEDVQLVKKEVPQNTKPAFDAVTNAGSDVAKLISEARGYAATTANAAQGEAQKIKSDAEAYKRHLEATAVADADFVKSVAAQYRKDGSSAVLVPQYVDALNEVLKNARHIVVLYPNQEVRVTIEPKTDGKDKPEDKPKK